MCNRIRFGDILGCIYWYIPELSVLCKIYSSEMGAKIRPIWEVIYAIKGDFVMLFVISSIR